MATKKASRKSTSAKPRVGVIDSIVEFLAAANAKAPLTRDKLVSKLAARFKDRDADGLAATVNAQLGKRIEKGRKVKLRRNDSGYWISK